MPRDIRNPGTDGATAFPVWGLPSAEVREGLFAEAAWWFGGGASLLVWTALALLLTA